MTLKITSPAFAPGTKIPQKYTCDGEDISPPLQWSKVPEGTQSLVLIMEDPDAPDPADPKMTWDHWLLYNLPADIDGLPEAVSTGDLPTGTLQGSNSWNRSHYGGPCPPIGNHRYFFKLYALNIKLPDLKQPDKNQLLKQMQGHVLQNSWMVGKYQR